MHLRCDRFYGALIGVKPAQASNSARNSGESSSDDPMMRTSTRTPYGWLDRLRLNRSHFSASLLLLRRRPGQRQGADQLPIGPIVEPHDPFLATRGDQSAIGAHADAVE